ncbi:MAG: hypothetical protein IJN50_00610 [Clostridia bacterium]|nr:hypothetical protein [Clostridia bacterium]
MEEELKKELHEICKRIIAEYKNRGKLKFEGELRDMYLKPEDMNDRKQYDRIFSILAELKLDLIEPYRI